MLKPATRITAESGQVVLERGELRIEIILRPFAFTIRRTGRRLVRAGGLWAADGTIHDHFIQLTEGVVCHEDRSPAEHVLRAAVRELLADGVELDAMLHGGRTARVGMGISEDDGSR